MLVPATVPVASAASGGDRTIYLHHTHTGETGKFTFRKNGQYDQAVLRQLNVFLADWRTKDQIKMDPALFDLLWTVYQEVGATNPINIVSSYRAPKTNAMLRAKSSGVAENSQHMKGKAIDFFIPGIKLATLRETVMRHQVGGIGYYPTSGSPFVHADTGSVRAWPRMTRAQLKKVFPDGKTLHLPTDGTPLSSAGRQYAQAEWTKCHAVPCSRSPFTGNPFLADPQTATPNIMIAEGEAPIPLERPSRIYGRQGEGIMTAALSEPTQRTVSTFEVAPTPLSRPDFARKYADELANPFPAQRPASLMVASTGGALEAIDKSAPQPRVLMTPRDDTAVIAAYAPANQALEMLIENEQRTPLASALKGGIDSTLTTASLGGASLGTMFDKTFDAVSGAVPVSAAEAVRQAALRRLPNSSINQRHTELVAPELDHVDETLTMPVLMSDSHFAELYEAEGYLDKEAELGPMANRLAFLPDLGQSLDYDQFVTNAPLLTASR